MADQEYLNILSAISEYQKFHTSVILTYGANLAFYEQAILIQLWKASSRNNLIFMDADPYYDTIDDYRDVIGYVGRRYMVVPIQLGFLQSFHPKLILLLGTDQARLLIGSGNLTFNGYGNNHEIFTQLDWSLENTEYQRVFSDVWQLIIKIQEQWGHSPQTDRMLQKAQARSEWLLDETENSDIKLFHSLDKPLMDQLREIVQESTIKKLTILSPFLDNQAEAVKQYNSIFNPEQIDLILQHQRVVGNTESLRQLQAAGVPLKFFGIYASERYVHAKIYLFETHREKILACGSANCTSSGLLKSSESGNFETLLVKEYETQSRATNIIQNYFQLESITNLDSIQLRPHTSITEAQRLYIVLLDLLLEGQSVDVKFKLNSLPENVHRLGLQISFPVLLEFPLDNFHPGLNNINLIIPEKYLEIIYQAAISATICGLDEKGEIIDLLCNKLWFTNTSELNQRQIFLTPNDEKAGHLLNEMALGSDEDWRVLFESITALVELDIDRMQSIKRETPSGKLTKSKESTNEQVRETEFRIVDDDNYQSFGISNFEAEIYQESRLHSWLEIVFAQFPGEVKKTTITTDYPPPKKPPRKPNYDLGKRFVSLVRRFIHSLNNTEFMQTAPPFYLLAYFSIFQRITWLLLKHQVINLENYAKFALSIHSGYFSDPDSRFPPFLVPELHNHLKWRNKFEWVDNLAHLYAITSLIALKNGHSNKYILENYDANYEDLITHTFACLCSIISPMDLLDDIDGISKVAQSYDMDEVDLFEKINLTFNDYLPKALNKLTKWSTQTILSLQEQDTEEEKMLLYNIRVSIGISAERIADFLELSNERASQCGELIYWTDRINDRKLTTYYQQQLVELLEQQGDLRSLVVILLNQGMDNLKCGDYDQAMSFLLQARTLTRKLQDDNRLKTIDTLISTAQFLSKIY